MNLRVGVQMDPIETIAIAGDTTFAMMEAAQARGHTLYVYQPDALSYREGRVFATARPVTVKRQQGDHAALGPAQALDLADDLDVILMRQDPPFDMHYITAAHLLELVHPRTLVVNDPFWVRSSPEKISPLLFPQLQPPTLVTRDLAAMRAFRADHGDVVVKPLYGKAGEGVFLAKADDGNFAALIELFLATRREAIQLQAFIPAVFEGDKRIILIEGEPAGVLNRKPQGRDIRSNLAAGGVAEAADLSDADRAICAAIGPTLRERGLVFVGIDVIAGRLTEINVTSPTGAMAIRGLGGPDLMPLFWDAVEARRART